jgi:hypothetical protein
MGRPHSWKRTTRGVNAPKKKREYKRAIHRRNRRAARQNPEAQDKPLNAWDFD